MSVTRQSPFVAVFFIYLLSFDLGAQALRSVPLSELSHAPSSAFSKAAFLISASKWKHAEGRNFIYHYFDHSTAAAVATESEFYYGFFSRELGRDTTDWERKGHIYIFNSQAEWELFKVAGQLDPWTGGIHSNNELFILRPEGQKFGGHTLAHEVVHLVLFRFYGPGIPLWLNEGYAEYGGIRAYATFYRIRGYRAKPHSRPVSEEGVIPLADFVSITNYPADVFKASLFYDQSERLVRFLSAASKPAFGKFLEYMSKGNTFESALAKSYKTQFPTVTALERQFRAYVSQEFSSSIKSFSN
jgi:hypothetical protein